MNQLQNSEAIRITNAALMTTIVVLLIVALILSGCVAPAAAPADGGADSGGESSADNRGRDDSAPGNTGGYAAPSSVESSESDAAEESSTSAMPSRPSASSAEGEAAADSASSSSGDRVGVPAAEPSYSDRYEPVTAGVVDDNEDWADYLEYRRRTRVRNIRDRDVSERYVIIVQDENGLPVHDAEVAVYAGDDEIFKARSDAGGQVLFHPLALENRGFGTRNRTREFAVAAQKGYVAERNTFDRYGDEVWALTLTDAPAPAATQLDLLFMIDATGSMDDEIAKLKASMADIANQIDELQEQPDVRYGLVHYRDRGDAYVVRTHDFTHDLGEFQDLLAAVQAGGGGDTPESMNEALHRSLNELSWRSQERDGETVRLIILVADAPPHLDYRWQDYSYESDMVEAVGMGIKIFPVGASGLEADGEFIYRQIAQFTGGKFVFLTYEDGSDPSSGAGTETEHDVDNYSVNTLDKLVVRLVRDELTKLTEPIVLDEIVQAVALVPTPRPPRPTATPTRRPTPTPRPPRVEPITCELDLDNGRNNCGGIAAIQYIDMYRASRRASDGQAVLKLTLDPRRTGYTRAAFEVIYSDTPQGWTVNIGDSQTNNGHGGDTATQSNDAEAVMLEGSLIVYANDYVPSRHTTDGHREFAYYDDMVRSEESIYFEVSNQTFIFDSPGGNETLSSQYLYALSGQSDREGRTNYDIFAAFNRTVSDAGRSGVGASKVVLTLYPR